MKQQKLKSYYKQFGNKIVYFLLDKNFQQYFKGIAVCQPQDTFVLETGIRIAKQKALVKLNSWYMRLCSDRLDLIERLKEEEQIVREDYNKWNNRTQRSYETLTRMLKELE